MDKLQKESGDQRNRPGLSGSVTDSPDCKIDQWWYRQDGKAPSFS